MGKMGAKFGLRPFRSEVKQKLHHNVFTSCIVHVDVHTYKHISLTHYRVVVHNAIKNCKVRAGGTEKRTTVPPIVLTETL